MRRDVTNATITILEVLNKEGMLDKSVVSEYLDQLRGTNIVKVRFSRHANYRIVAEMLKEHGMVFIPISRRASVYALDALRRILGDQVYKDRAHWGEQAGYVIYFDPVLTSVLESDGSGDGNAHK